jgi:hypothetical protein
MTASEIFYAFVNHVFTWFGGGVAVVFLLRYLGKLFAKWVVDSALEEQKTKLGKDLEVKKAELARELEDKKGEIARELELLKGELTRDTETYKLKLRKQELFFAKEVEAASAFIELHHELRPPISSDDMEYEDACIELAGKLFAVEGELKRFRVKHGAALSADVRRDLDDLIATVGHAKFGELEYNSTLPPMKAAAEVLETLGNIEERVLAAIRG